MGCSVTRFSFVQETFKKAKPTTVTGSRDSPRGEARVPYSRVPRNKRNNFGGYGSGAYQRQ